MSHLEGAASLILTKSHLIRVAGEFGAVAGTQRQSDSIWSGLCFSRDTGAVLLTRDWAE